MREQKLTRNFAVRDARKYPQINVHLFYVSDLKSLLVKALETEPDWSRCDINPKLDEDLWIQSPTGL